MSLQNLSFKGLRLDVSHLRGLQLPDKGLDSAETTLLGLWMGRALLLGGQGSGDERRKDNSPVLLPGSLDPMTLRALQGFIQEKHTER